MNKIGNLIKSRRLSKSISLATASEELKISRSILEKIENDIEVQDYDPIFIIGHVRSYCNFLELDTNEIVKNFKVQISYNKNHSVEKISKPIIKTNLFYFQRSLPISLVIVIFVSFYMLFMNDMYLSRDYALIPDLPENHIPTIEKANLNNLKENTLSVNDNEVKSINETFSLNSANASAQDENYEFANIITLKLLNPTWLQLRDKSNNIILSKLMDKNEEFSYDVSLMYNITAGNAGNILVLIDNDVRGKIGKYGEIVDAIVLDKDFKN